MATANTPAFTSTSNTPKMKAIARTEYGSPDVLQLVELDRPSLTSDSQVLVKVHAAAVHAGDWHLMRGTPFLLRLIYGGLRKPQIKILGTDAAGEVVAVGQTVTRFKPGDLVYGDLSESGFGSFAEYVCVPEKTLALKPTNLTFEAAATVPVSALAALQGLRDAGHIRAGHKVLINGASGGVGSFAIQLAKAFGAEVTAICSASKAEMVRSLGADEVIDYAKQFPSALQRQHYDLILDAAAYRSVFDYLPALKPKGVYILVGGSTPRLFGIMAFGSIIGKLKHCTVRCLVSQPNPVDLGVLKELIEADKLKPYIDRTFPLNQTPDAVRHLEQRQVRGKVAILMQ